MAADCVLQAGISVVICCYNSASRIEQVLLHLAAQQIAPSLFEVILVNNNSTDETAMVASQVASQHLQHVAWKIVHEPIPGLSAARKRGIAEAERVATLFCDDDNLLAPTYLSIAWSLLEQDPRIGVLGGWGRLKTDGSIPDWFTQYEAAYACGPQGNQAAYVTLTRGYLYGAGLCFRTTLMRSILAEKALMLTDRIGARIVSGGDSELCLLIGLAGFEMYYDPALQFDHWIASKRLTVPHLHALFESFGASYPRLFALQQQLKVNSCPQGSLFRLWIKRMQSDVIAILRYLVRGPRTTVTIPASWTWGLTKAYWSQLLNVR